MWTIFLILSIVSIIASIVVSIVTHSNKGKGKVILSPFNCLLSGVFVASVFVFFPIHLVSADQTLGVAWRAFLLSLFNSIQVFAAGCEFGVVTDSIAQCPEKLNLIYQIWTATIFILAPVFTFGFVLSLFKNFSAYLKYLCSFFKDVYIFSELNEKSLALATDIRNNHKKSAIIFTDVFENNDEQTYELMEDAKKIGPILFKKDITNIDFKKHSVKKSLYFFTVSSDEAENLDQSLKLIEAYNQRKNTNIYVFSTQIESELLLTSIDKGEIHVRRVNEVKSLINRVLYDQGDTIFKSAGEPIDGVRHISAIVVGMGNHGTEMVKALAWYGQMDGYSLEINAFDKDPLAEEKFTALAPELMSSYYNGVSVPGEAMYKINIHSGVDVNTFSFAKKISELNNATYVFISLGSDNLNINTAVNLRMYFERMKIHPVIQTVVYSSRQKRALDGIKNYRNQSYDINFIGDIESSFAEKVIIDSELEENALKSHLKWGNEDEFWTFEYNYRSSIASFIHLKARVLCGIPGASKHEEDLSDSERETIETLEHRRWNAYMRAEGYVFSGSKDKSSRNDLAKMHHDLVDFSALSEEDKRKDSRVGTI